MAKLHFRYGAMGSSKTANALMVEYNYRERGKKALLVKPKIDSRDGDRVLRSRIGLEGEGIYLEELVEMEDEGPGIPAKERNRIFQRFYRGESESVRRKEGSGVGLYLTRQILERQGGTVCMKNGGNGGSHFVMTLPKR